MKIASSILKQNQIKQVQSTLKKSEEKSRRNTNFNLSNKLSDLMRKNTQQVNNINLAKNVNLQSVLNSNVKTDSVTNSINNNKRSTKRTMSINVDSKNALKAFKGKLFKSQNYNINNISETSNKKINLKNRTNSIQYNVTSDIANNSPNLNSNYKSKNHPYSMKKTILLKRTTQQLQSLQKEGLFNNLISDDANSNYNSNITNNIQTNSINNKSKRTTNIDKLTSLGNLVKKKKSIKSKNESQRKLNKEEIQEKKVHKIKRHKTLYIEKLFKKNNEQKEIINNENKLDDYLKSLFMGGMNNEDSDNSSS